LSQDQSGESKEAWQCTISCLWQSCCVWY